MCLGSKIVNIIGQSYEFDDHIIQMYESWEYAIFEMFTKSFAIDFVRNSETNFDNMKKKLRASELTEPLDKSSKSL